MSDPTNREVAVLNAALELHPAERAAYLDEACAGDAALRQQVEALLRADAAAEGFLETPPARLGAPRTARETAPLTEKPGDKISHYKLLQQIGEGGCGVVYMAEQEEPVRRRVALKVIKLGMDTKQVIARFDAERQALALMDHPNIAKIFDAGITESPLPVGRGEGKGEGSANSQPSTLNPQLSPGRPYFVMELVRGIKITDFCDENRVSTADRLKLFVQVCQAIQHAHQKGIIHRDIKPSNILVTVNDGVPVPKVIDFGIAKATQGRLTDQTLFTAFEQFIGTPAYMSPEQAVMTSLDVDTRSDIYSLGVLLYELLTGKTPFDQQELLAAGLDEMRRTIREKEPPRPSTRLSAMSADALTTTAKRCHTDAPKLLHAVQGDLDWIVMKCLEKDRARRYETANGLAMDITRHLECEPVVARPPSRWYEFQKTVRRHKFGFAAGAALVAVLMIGVVVSTVEAVRATRAERDQIRQREQADTARNEEARERTKAEANERKAATEAAKSQQVARLLKKTLLGVGPSVALGRDTTLLREILERTVQSVGAELTNQPEVEVEVRLTLGMTYYELGLYQQMEAMDRQSLQLARARLGPENENVANSLFELGRALIMLGQLDEAEQVTRDALAMWKKLHGDEDASVAHALNSLACVFHEQGKFQEAETTQRDLLAMNKELFGDAHLLVAQSLGNLAGVLSDEGKLIEAEGLYREGLAMWKKLSGDENPDVAMALMNVARQLYEQARLPEAETLDREALAMRRKLLGNEHPDVAVSLINLAGVLADEGKLPEAEALLREALSVARRTSGSEPEHETPLLGCVTHELAEILRQRKALPAARALALESAALYQRHPGWPAKERQHSREVLTGVFEDLGDLAALETILRDALEQQKKRLGNEHPDVAGSLANLAGVLSLEDKLGEAETMYREALALVRNSPAHDPYQETSNLGVVLHHLAEVLRERKSLTEARPLAVEAVVVYQRHPEWRPNEQAHAMAVLKSVFYDLGDLPGLEAFHREALKNQRKLYGNEHPEVVDSLSKLASVLRDESKLAEAEATYREALFLARKIAAQDPAHGTSKLGVILHHLAEVLRRRKAPAEARPLAEEAAAMYQHHPEWPSEERDHALQVLTDVFTDLGDLAGLEVFLRDALEKQRKLLGNEHPDVAASVNDLGYIIEHQGRLAEAEVMFHEAAEHGNVTAMNALAWLLATGPDLQLWSRASAVGFAEKAVAATDRKDPVILDTLAAAYAAAGQCTKAVRVQGEAMALVQNVQERNSYAVRLRLYESNSPYRDESLLAEATSALLVRGKFAEAEPLAREWLALREKELPDHWQTFNVRGMLGDCLLGRKKYAEAEPLLLSGYEGLKQREDQIPVDAVDRLAEAAGRLVQLYELTSQPPQAAEWKNRQAVALAAARAAPEAETRRAGGVAHAQHGRFAEAVADFARAIELRPGNHEAWHCQAPTLVQSGQLDAYHELRRRSVERFGHTTDPNTAERIAKDYLMLPSSEAALETVAKMAETAVSAATNHPDMTWFQFCKGLAEYRQGHFAGAVDWIQKVLAHAGDDNNRDVEAYMVLAMAQHRSKQAGEAGTTLAKGVEIAERKLPKLDSGDLGDGWLDWIIAHALMREARELIHGLSANATEKKSEPH